MQILEVSCRKNDGWLGELTVGDLRFFSSPDGTVMTREQFSAAIEGKRVLNFTHGFHNKEAAADQTVETVAAQVERAGLGYDVVVLFSWSGGITYAGFGIDVVRTKRCGAKLAELLAIEQAAGCAIDCASHSLGAEVTAYALLNFNPIRFWIALAAAISNKSLAKGEKFDSAKLGADRIFVPFSSGDSVLKWAFPLGSYLQTALGRTGPAGETNPSKVRAIDVSHYVHSHSEAYSAPEVYDTWRAFQLRLV